MKRNSIIVILIAVILSVMYMPLIIEAAKNFGNDTWIELYRQGWNETMIIYYDQYISCLKDGQPALAREFQNAWIKEYNKVTGEKSTQADDCVDENYLDADQIVYEIPEEVEIYLNEFPVFLDTDEVTWTLLELAEMVIESPELWSSEKDEYGMYTVMISGADISCENWYDITLAIYPEEGYGGIVDVTVNYGTSYSAVDDNVVYEQMWNGNFDFSNDTWYECEKY